MKEKLIYIALIVFYMIAGCSSPNKHQLETEEFMPMKIGNKWYYEGANTSKVEEIFDTLRVNEKLYYGFTKGTRESGYWMREKDNKIYYLNLNDSTEFILFDFDASIGNSWEFPSGYECNFGLGVTLESISDTVISPYQRLYNCYHFKYQQVCRDAGMIETWFVKGIGIVKFSYVNFMGIQEYELNNYSFRE